jgi:hypothetical protein
MTTVDLNKLNNRGGGQSTDRPVLPTDTYRMKIVSAKLEEDNYGKPGADGQLPIQLVVTWEIASLTEEQREAATEENQDWNDVRVWQRLNPYYGTVKAGGPSKFKAFIDNFRQQKLIEFEMAAFDPESLVGIEQKVGIERYLKTMGENAGQPGNRVTMIAPLARKRAAAPAQEPTPDANDY